MKTLLLVVLLGTTMLAQDAPKLSETQQLKKDAFLLRMENATLKAQLQDQRQRVTALETVFRIQIEQQFQKDSQELGQQCKALEAEFRTALKVDAAKTFDCSTLEFK